MDRHTLELVFVVVGSVSQIIALAAYMSSARWWRNPVGRFLVTLGAIVVMWYAKALFTGLPNLTTWNIVFHGLIAALMLYWAIGMTRLTLRVRRDARRCSRGRNTT